MVKMKVIPLGFIEVERHGRWSIPNIFLGMINIYKESNITWEFNEEGCRYDIVALNSQVWLAEILSCLVYWDSSHEHNHERIYLLNANFGNCMPLTHASGYKEIIQERIFLLPVKINLRKEI